VNGALRIRTALVVAALLALAVAGAALAARVPARKSSKAAATASADTSKVLVRLGGNEFITADDVRKRLEEIPDAARAQFNGPDGRRQLLEQMTEERVWLLVAQKSGVGERPAVQQQLAQQRRNLLIRTYLTEQMAAAPAPNDSETRAFYEEHKSEYQTPAAATVRHIQLKTEAQARQVMKLAQAKGADWGKLAEKWSADTLTRRQGGLLGTVTRDGLFHGLGRQPALAESAFALGTGKVGGPVRTDRGWHVIQVDEVKPEGARPFETVRVAIQRQMSGQRNQDYYRRLLEDARRSLGVTADSSAIRDYVSAKRDARTMFKEAQELGPPAERIAAYRTLLETYPDSEVSPQAQFMVGFIQSEELKDYESAEKSFRTLLERYPKSELTASAQWMVEHMRSEEAPPFDLTTEGDSTRVVPKAGSSAKR
jgi:peptidyl-prolyl cis-trans isomerase C